MAADPPSNAALVPAANPGPSARDELLDRIVDEVARNGLADRSLRDLAAAVGSSHRMLHYHFGSREGLVRAIVERVEATQRAVLLELARDAPDAPALIRALWARVSAPELLPFVRLFFETIAYASRDETGIDLTAPWLADSAAATARLGLPYDPTLVRLGVAVIRGLLVDVVAGHASADADAALERFLDRWPAS